MEPAVTQNPILTGYESLKVLYKGQRTLVYRAVRTVDQMPVVIKTTPRHLTLSFSDHLAFRNQFTIGHNLDHPGLVRLLSLESVDSHYGLVMEDVQGTSLEEGLQFPVSLAEGLQIAVQLADILHYLYQERVIHKDIKPANILMGPDHQQVYLIDFSLSSLLPKETQEIKNPNILEGTLAYMAPEQTGRMNRGIDFRTDFYSLGVTLFELFAGQLPFDADEPMDWLHCHIAQQPPSLMEFGLPETVAAIVSKLLAKNAEDRYQSALGLKHDLEQCFTQLTDQGEIQIFELGVRDICDRFLIPEKLYGREAEVKTLLDAFDRVAQGRSELMLVAGFSGIGKTAVVNEVHKPITQKSGYFIKGKFDQFNRSIPFSAFVQAFRSLMGQLLGESDIQLSSWKTKILAAVGESGQVLIEVIPELERIIGKQPVVPDLSGTAAQNRFNLLFGKFIQVFATPEHPLVIFLDDLQWADLASLNLLKLLMAESTAGYLLILGAYRNNEVFPAHPLMMTLDEIEKQHTVLQTVTLGPLSQSNINILVANTLQCEPEMSSPLTELMYMKTQGNPFFTHRFFLSLHQDGHITYDSGSGHWQYDFTQVQQLTYTDDVVGFMVRQLQKLPSPTQEILKIAACIGNQFALSTLSVVSKQPQEYIALALWSALQAGLIIPDSETYKFFQGNSSTEIPDYLVTLTYHFLHDRVQQAAYSLIPEKDKERTHYQIGKLLCQNVSQEQLEANVFAIVGQLNRGQTLLTQQSERDNLAQLNLSAGLRSKNTTAYKAGFEYARTGLTLLGDHQWQKQYELTLKLTNLATELAFLVGDFSAMESLVANIHKHAQQPIDQSSAVQTKIQFYNFQQNFNAAISTARDYLENLDFLCPKNLSFEDIKQEYRNSQPDIQGTSHQEILELPVLSDPKQLAIANTLISVSVPAIVSDTNLFWLIILKLVKLSLKNGNSPYSAYAYASYGILINLIEQDIEAYYQFGQLGLDVVDLFEKNTTKCRVLQVIGAYTAYLKSHLRTSVSLLERAYKSGLESGDFEFASYSVCGRCQFLLFSNEPLFDLQIELSRGAEALDKLNNQFSSDLHNLVTQAVFKLTGQLGQPQSLNSDFFELDKRLESLKVINDKFSLQHFCLYEMLFKYLFLDRNQILSFVSLGEECLDAVTGWLTEYIFRFYESLIYLEHLQCTKDLETEQVTQYLQKIQVNQVKFARLAESAPMNFQHKYDLVEAEKNRFLDNKWDALELYDTAIKGAKENRYLQEEALANERAAQFYLSWGKEKIASTYMQEAYHCYARWGAKAKTDDLERRYPEILQPILQAASPSIHPLDTLASLVDPNLSIHSSASVHSAQTNFNAAFDFSAILKGAQVLSDSLHIDELLNKLAPMMLQNSGADRLVFLLPDADTWQIRVTATPELTQLCLVPLTDHLDLPLQLIQYVKNTQETLVIDDLKTDLPILDRYLETHQPQSVLCLPILYQGSLSGLLYLQNQSTAGVFTCDRITVLNFLCSQAAIALENARLYQLEQHRAAQLASSEQRLQTLFNQTADAVFLLGEQGFIDCNQAAVDLLRYSSKADLILLHPHQISPEKQPDGQLSVVKMKQLNQEAIEKGSLQFEWLSRRRDGETFWVENTLTPIQFQEEMIFHCTARDISDRKNLEQEQAKLTAVLEATPDFIGIATPTGEEVWCNKPLRGLRPDLSHPNQQGPSNYHPEWVNDILVREAFPAAIEQGTWSGELALLDAAGNEIPVSQVIIAHKAADGTVEYFSTIMRDIRERKQTTAALSLSEARLNAAFEQAALGFAETDIKTGKFIRVNTLFCELTGYTQAELAAITMSELTHPEDVPASIQAIQKLSSGEVESFTLEKRYLRKDGTCFWAETTAYLVKVQGGEAAYSLGIIQDISERKATEKALSLTQFAVENAATSLFWINDAGGFIEVNEAACQSLGYSPEELMEKRIWDIDLNFPCEAWSEHWQTLKQHSYQQFESHHQTKDHRIFPVEITSNYLEYDGQGFIFAQVQDIGKRKQAETALRFTQYSVDNAADCTFWIKPNGDFAYANQAASKMHGYSLDELMLMSVFEINPTMTSEGWQRHWQQVKQQGSFSLEGVHQSKAGRVFPVEVVVNFLEFDGDEFNFVRVRDISDRKAAEAELHRLNTELEQRVQARTQELSQALGILKSAQVSLVESEKMAALGTLVAGVAHEINTPIGTSITVASTLADETEIFLQATESGQLKRSILNRYLDVARRCSMLLQSNLERAGELIQSFKQVAVDQSHCERRTFNLKAYLQEVVTSLQPQVKRSGHQLHLTGDDAITLINDPGVFAQVVTNLVTNSIKHAYPNGDSGQLQLHIDHRDHQIVLTYRDDGCGIPSAYLSKVYEPFFTTARSQGGTGLGLNIVYNIVSQSLNGTIELESQEGQGTTFVIILPYR